MNSDRQYDDVEVEGEKGFDAVCKLCEAVHDFVTCV